LERLTREVAAIDKIDEAAAEEKIVAQLRSAAA